MNRDLVCEAGDFPSRFLDDQGLKFKNNRFDEVGALVEIPKFPLGAANMPESLNPVCAIVLE